MQASATLAPPVGARPGCHTSRYGNRAQSVSADGEGLDLHQVGWGGKCGKFTLDFRPVLDYTLSD